jgi:hypothetical protein
MRLAIRALTLALATLVLCAAATAQTPRSESDPRNQSPSVGTGGPEGGPTGLFTIYDGSTIRRGEFTFSIAYSNFDRDPGNVDIADAPVSFNVGVNDHIELFFKTNGYRGIKVNAPQNLSSFYLPNVGLCGPSRFCSGPAVILAPTRVSGPSGLTGPFFRPFNNQAFVQFPFVGGIGPNLGAPNFVSTLGPAAGGTGGNFDTAANFPGIGSVFGSILPGIVLATSTVAGVTVPATFTTAPSYLPDAPFVSRVYGESNFTNFVVGAKIRFTGPHNPLGAGIIPFYRWYPDKANDFGGFNQLQRGASPGGNIGDFGLIGFIDGRLSTRINLSVNGGFIINSNPKFQGSAVALDRPNEFLAGIGFDFPVNKHFQPVIEVRSTQYVGGRTPNAFENSPVDFLAGVKVYPRRWWGLAGAFRWHVNQQDSGHFNRRDANTTVNILVVGQGVTTTTVPATTGGVPRGFQFSDNPYGFIGQLWIGRRNARGLPPPPNQPPTVTLSASSATITTPCPEGMISETCTPSASREVQLTADARDPDNDTLLYTYTVTGGKLSGEGRTVTWDLSGVNLGTYTATVEVNDGNQHTATASTTVTIAECTGCKAPCPTISVSCPDAVDVGSPITFTASIAGGPSSVSPTYNWSVSAGTITGGQGTSSITVDTANLGGQTVTATVELSGFDPACAKTASCSTQVRVPPEVNPTKFDEYGNIKFNDEKARLDNYAIQLQNQPGSEAYIIAYGTCAGEGQARADRAKNYLVNTRGIEAGRIVTIDGGCRADLTVQLWIVPTGATKPAASTENTISPCPECKRRRAPRRHRARQRAGADEEE